MAKPKPVWHDGFAHRLVIKFTDEQVARLDSMGKPDLASNDDETELRTLLDHHAVQLAPLIDLTDAKLDSLEQLSSQPRDFRALYRGARSTDRDRQLAAALDLIALDAVEYVWLEPLEVPPPGDVAPTTELFITHQTYRGETGINADFAWTLQAKGAGVRLSDVEYGWTYDHEDLVDRSLNPEPDQTIEPQVLAYNWDAHGTAVIGETSAVDNGYGMTGLVPDADVYTYSEWTQQGGHRRAEAVAAAVAGSRPGDVVLLEMQTGGADGGYAPAEYDPAIWQIVKTATDAGVIVVAAAGNGNQNLDSPGYAEYRSRGDSGAIIVGAGNAAHAKMGFSTHGTRVDVHGWGENVASLGYGDLVMHVDSKQQAYTATFAGTSSASPIVASACVAIQSYAKAQLGRVLTPAEMRTLLVRTGTPQADPTSGNIGPLPNLQAALMQLGSEPPPPPPPGNLVINEILADPPASYDASGDGTASTTGDEFVELVNTGMTAIDLSGTTISDAVGVRVTLPMGTTLAPGGVLVVFGGGAIGPQPTGVTALSLGTLALNNSGDTITLKSGTTVLATATYTSEGDKDQSLVRAAEKDGMSAFVLHETVGPTPASPGTRADGTAL